MDLPLSDLRRLHEPLNVIDDDPAVTDRGRFQAADILFSILGNRGHFSQLLSLCGSSGMSRVLYIVGSPNAAIQMVDCVQSMTTRRDVEQRLGFPLCYGALDRKWPMCGVMLSHFIMRLLHEGGFIVLFDNAGDSVPQAIEDSSYVQNKVARIQDAQLRHSTMQMATAQRQPLPCIKYIRYSSVFAWNSIGKAGVDEASRKENAMMYSGLAANLAYRLSLRVISMQEVNALQVWRVVYAGSRLLRPASFATLTEMRRIMTQSITPRQFISTVLCSRGLPGVSVGRVIPERTMSSQEVAVTDGSDTATSCDRTDHFHKILEAVKDLQLTYQRAAARPSEEVLELYRLQICRR